MGNGRHASDEEFEFNFAYVKYGLIGVAILIVIVGVVFGAYSLLSKMKEEKVQETSAKNEEVLPETKYDVLGKIKIDKINVEQEILDSTEEEALENGVIKLYGDKLNEPGNFCIAGHNEENIFQRLEEMEIEDEIEIIDENEESVKYIITEIASVEPTDLSLLRTEPEKTQITLITCENYSTQRLIIKAEKME